VQEQEPTVRVRDYLSLLWVVAAAVLGMTMLCGVATVGINDINNAVLIGTPTAGVVKFFISNMNTLIVETAQVFPQQQLVITPTPTSTNTNTPTSTNTHTIIHLLPNGASSGNSVSSGAAQTQVAVLSPTSLVLTHTPLPPIPTQTLVPTSTNTPVPDTDTPVPDTDTPIPPTLTSVPPPDTDTPVPPDTDTPAPADTDTPSGP